MYPLKIKIFLLLILHVKQAGVPKPDSWYKDQTAEFL